MELYGFQPNTIKWFKSFLTDRNMLSVNQINAKIKLQEIWKAQNLPDYPLKIENKSISVDNPVTRACTSGMLIETSRKTLTEKTRISDAIRLWNNAPAVIKECTTLHLAKKATKTFVKKLPI